MTEISRVRLKIELAFTEPKIWRRTETPDDLSLLGLHEVIQALFEWKGYHLFEFVVADRRFSVPEPNADFADDLSDLSQTTLRDLIDDGIRELSYVYDFGDDWFHRIAIEAIEPSASAVSVRFVDGERRGPPEDIGGPPGLEALLEALGDETHPDHREMRRIAGRDYDPAAIDADLIKQRLSLIG